jgi:hypothetical protein
MDYTLSKHAQDAVLEREIRIEWLSATLADPVITVQDADDADLVHALKPIAEHGSRVLRVIYNKSKMPPNVVTVYFDRTMKGKL